MEFIILNFWYFYFFCSEKQNFKISISFLNKNPNILFPFFSVLTQIYEKKEVYNHKIKFLNA